MIEISLWKIFVVFLVAFIVLGPKQLLKTAAGAGKLLHQLKGMLKEMQAQLKDSSKK